MENPWQLFIHLHMTQGTSEAVDVEHVNFVHKNSLHMFN